MRLVTAVPIAILLSPCLGAAEARAAGGWLWPVRGEVVERFALGADPYAGGQHRGVDLAAARGTPVRAACGGRVRFAGPAGAFGRAVTVACGGFLVSYGHLAEVRVGTGDRVRRGARLGAVGASGRPSSPVAHLHLGVRRAGERHGYVDPLSLLEANRPPPEPPPAPLPVSRPRPPARVRWVPRPAPAPRPRPPASVRWAPRLARPARPGVPAVVWAGAGLLALAVPGLALIGARGRRGEPARGRKTTPTERVAIHN